MTDTTTLTVAAREINELQSELKAHRVSSEHREARIKEEIRKCSEVLRASAEGIDNDTVKLAKTVLNISDYAKGGKERASCVSDAIKQLSTGDPIRQTYSDLWVTYFGTKNYDRWSGQRSDHQYNYGPRHGGICFSVGLTKSVRSRDPRALSAEETEAAIYYLVNLERIQAYEKAATTEAANA